MDMEILKGATCPECGGSGVYQEYDDEFDRYHVHACAKCNGTGEIARQSVTDEQIRTALDYVNDYKKEAMEYDASVGIFPPASEEVRAWETVETALQAYQLPSAIKWTGDNLREVINLTGWNESASSKWTWEEYEQVVKEKGLKIFTPSGSVMADIGDWIIYNGKDYYVTTQKNQSATSEDVAEAISHIRGGYGDVWQWSKKRRDTIITALQAYQAWIPCSKRMPTEPYGCLVVVDEDDYLGDIHSVLLPYVVGYDGKGWNNVDGKTIPFEVTHWMPLPQVPKEDDT